MPEQGEPVGQRILCGRCGRWFGMAAGTGVLSADRIPDPFKATCPHCGITATHQKAAIQSVRVEKTNKTGN